MFFFLTLYMQNVLGYSQIKTGLSYLPLCFGVAIAAGLASRPAAARRDQAGDGRRRAARRRRAVLAGAGPGRTARSPADLLPGMMLAAFGLGAMFVSVTTAANEGVPRRPGGRRGGAAQRVAAGRRRAGPRDLQRAGDRPDARPAGRARPAARRADRRRPARAAGVRDLHRGRGGRRAVDDQLARRGAGRGRAGAPSPPTPLPRGRRPSRGPPPRPRPGPARTAPPSPRASARSAGP